MKYLIPVLLLFLITQTTQYFAPAANDLNMRNWMSKLANETKLALINIPGTHDTASNLINPLGKSVAKTQDLTIPELLRIGVRKFDVRIFMRKLSKGETDPELNLGTAHGIFDCYYKDENNNKRNLTLKQIFKYVRTFLQENPSETVIIWTQSERDVKYDNLKRAVELYNSVVGDILVHYNRYLTLGECRGKIVSVLYWTGLYDSQGRQIFHNSYDGGTNLEEIHKKERGKSDYPSWEVSGKVKVKELTEFFKTHEISFKDALKDFEKNPQNYPFTYYTSCTGEHAHLIPFPRVESKVVNPFLLKYNFKRGYLYGWIDSDFVTLELAKKIVETNFP